MLVCSVCVCVFGLHRMIDMCSSLLGVTSALDLSTSEVLTKVTEIVRRFRCVLHIGKGKEPYVGRREEEGNY